MSRSFNPFDEDEDTDFKPVKWNNAVDTEESETDGVYDKQRALKQEVMRRTQATVESSNRSVSLLHESEQIGLETAEELVRQGEVLKRSEKMVDKMEQDMKTSQRHINSIKSMFSGFTNYFRAKPVETPPQNESYDYKASNKLKEAMDNSKEQEDTFQSTHPLRLRKEANDINTNASASGSGYQPKNKVLQDYHQKIDNNLDDMSLGLGRLKNLALGLQTEIDEQDDVIGRLTGKVDNLDLNIKTTDEKIKREL
ncbi:synaptosomal-associated protein 29 [Pelobates fuscus]|uniref:synaptosomal-associated protein 29 n=1 Tax=Pelobates fuscus TaxID=191477 RepID=UPI002FE4CCE8